MIENVPYFLNFILQFIKELLEFLTSLTFWDGIIFSIVLFSFVFFLRRIKKYRVLSVTVNLPFKLGNITYKPTDDDRIVAWKLYTQLKTRKAALIFDEDQDVIDEVYDSLYELFPISRDLLMNLPLYEIERKPSIADLVLRVQNDGLRPHLTKWQYDFRKWWDKALENPDNKDCRPQDIQKKYPKYKELMKELKEMNIELNKYAEDLLNIAKTPTKIRLKERAKIKKLKPLQPSEEPSESEAQVRNIEASGSQRP